MALRDRCASVCTTGACDNQSLIYPTGEAKVRDPFALRWKQVPGNEVRSNTKLRRPDVERLMLCETALYVRC
jgi:hypothetical protein